MHILGVHTGHDAAACVFRDNQMLSYCKEERLTRRKNDGGRFRLQAVDEVLDVAGLTRDEVDVIALSRMHLPLSCYYKRKRRPLLELSRKLRGIEQNRSLFSEMVRQAERDETRIVNLSLLKEALAVLPRAEVMFVNHHYSHVLGAFRFTDWSERALYVSCDAAGDGVHYSAYAFDGRELRCIFGGDETLLTGRQNGAASIGIAYSHVTRLLGFKINRHEGKITGLAAFGEPVAGDSIRNAFRVTRKGRIDSVFGGVAELRNFLERSIAPLSREDAAASIQYAAESLIVDWVKSLLNVFPARYIGMSGGVFSNVRINQRVCELEGVDEVYIFPAMGDEGLPVGHCVEAMIQKRGLPAVERSRLGDVYFGREYSAADLLSAARRECFFVSPTNHVAQATAKLLAQGQIGALYSQRMEMGPRALGARSILASPQDRGLNDSLNKRLVRTEFMPFAPYVLDSDAEEVFVIDNRNREACRFMTITADVKPRYREVIPAVVHVDQTARPQIIEKRTNSLYYDILDEFKRLTNIPCLVNTSFNVHEEPIINTPQEALTALREKRIDFLIHNEGLIFDNEKASRPR